MKSLSGNWRLPGSLTLVAVTLLVAGCLSKRAGLTEAVRAIPNASFKVVDQRPGDERTTQWLSDVPYACTFTVRQVGDDAMSPDRMTLLMEGLDSRLHEGLAGKTLLVTHFGIYINSSQRSRASAIMRGAGLTQSVADYAMGSRLERLCRSEEVREGWLDAADAATTRPVVLVQITLAWEGRTLHARGFFVPHSPISSDARAPETAAAILGAIERASDQITDEVLVRPGTRTHASAAVR